MLTPEKTALLANYPNPFNPETWIPYQLAEPATVSLHIYAVNGALVRTLDLGHQPAGVYQQRTRAAYWDGRNQLGEPVASGVYFYRLTAGDFTATRQNVDKEIVVSLRRFIMKTVKYIFFVLLTFTALGFGTAQAQENLAQEAYTIFQQSLPQLPWPPMAPLPRHSSFKAAKR